MHQDNENYYSNHCKESEEDKQQRGERDLFHKVQEIKEKFKWRLEMLKEQQGDTLSNKEVETVD